MASFLSYERSVAPPDFNRWLIPPAALAVHLSIGQAYAFSVFKSPLSHVPGVDWPETRIFYTFSIAIAFLGISTAIFGGWLERVGPRKVIFTAALCFAGGFFLSALAVYLKQLWLLYLGYGVLGGVGLGLGYIAPVANLIRWFADRPGLASGMAIMGFGGGAMVASPLSVSLMSHFKSGNDPGVWQTFVVMGLIYGAAMIFGACLIRVPPKGWVPAGHDPNKAKAKSINVRSLDTRSAMRTPQFWLLWLVLCTNTTAGIGIIEQAAPMIGEMFRSRLGASITAAGAGFVGLMSLFNMLGRFGWSTASDYIGRKATFMCFFVIGIAGYLFLPRTSATHLDSLPLFVLTAGILLSMYGGGFATIPAYLRDIFGPASVGAIYGRLLTAWSVAGVLGPSLVNYLRDARIHAGVPANEAYSTVLTVMAGLLVIGLISNLLVRPLSDRYFQGAASNVPQSAAAGAH